jgi:transcriptional regulator with XRE-family HTH domain
MTFGERLRNLRIRNDERQEDLGKLLKVTKATISKYEKDIREVDFESIKILATHFNVTIDYLLGQDSMPQIIAGNKLPQELSDAVLEYIKLFKHAEESGLTKEDIKEALEFAEKMKKKGK